MKKLIVVVISGLTVLALSLPAFAQASQGKGEYPGSGDVRTDRPMGGTLQSRQAGEEWPDATQTADTGIPAGADQRQIAPTGDGGVAVLSGDRLLKYDQDLNLIKETRIEAD